jgi:Uma2 family endonuclease
MRQVSIVRRRLTRYQEKYPDRIYEILGTMECKILVWDFVSERHPDLAIYLVPPLIKRGRELWRRWLPEVVVEVVSHSSVDRDYVEKREEYWALGIKEYWIVDAQRGRILVLRRGRTRWIERSLKRGDILKTKLLPGFKLACDEIFDAAAEEEDD